MPSALRLVLASASPQRQNLLREAGYDFIVHPANIDEENYPPQLTPIQLAEYLAKAKVEAVAIHYPDDVTIGSDTVVAIGQTLYGKAIDATDARRILSALSGSTHQVITGVAVAIPCIALRRSTASISTVQMRVLSVAELDEYVAGGQWQGKAGAYGIQDNDPFVTNIGGSLTNIIGLPMEVTVELLTAAGIHPARPTICS